MRIALLLEGNADRRVVMLPHMDRLTRALGGCFPAASSAEHPAEHDVVLLKPVGAGLFHEEEWINLGLGDRVTEVDEDAALASSLADAKEASERGDASRATDLLREADAFLGGERSTRHADVLVRLAALERATADGGDLRAANLLDEALSIDPHHRLAMLGRLELSRAASDLAMAATLRRRLLEFAVTDDERVRALSAIADDALAAAVEAMRAALHLRPNHRVLLERLRAMHEAAGDFSQAVDVAVARAETMVEPKDRARALVAAAELCASRAKNVDRAVALYEAAIADDPEVPGAFAAIEGVLLDNADFVGAEKAYVRQLERLAGRGAHESEAALLLKLARVRSEKLGDLRGAVQALDDYVVLRPQEIEARSLLSQLLEAIGDHVTAARTLEVAARIAPARVGTFQALHRIFDRVGDVDRSYHACSVLVHLGEADIGEQLVYQQYAPDVSLAPKRPLDESGWDLLYPDEHDREISAIIRAIAPAAVSLRVEELRAKKKLPRLDVKERHDLERSTVSAVRTVGWTAKLFGMRAPDVYPRDAEIAGGIALIPAIEPAIALGKSMLSGRSVPELTFLIGYELAWQRAAERMVAMYPSIPELRNLVVAAIATVVPSKGLPTEVATLGSALGQRLDAVQRFKLDSAVKQLTARGGQIDLLSWIRCIERTACRAGLLASGDITVAARILAIDGRVVSGLTAADRVRDLIPFSVSERYATLRRAIGVSAGGG